LGETISFSVSFVFVHKLFPVFGGFNPALEFGQGASSRRMSFRSFVIGQGFPE